MTNFSLKGRRWKLLTWESFIPCQSPDKSFGADATELDQEHSELLARLTDIQQEKWYLEEKVCGREISGRDEKVGGMKGGEKGVNVKYNKSWNFHGG